MSAVGTGSSGGGDDWDDGDAWDSAGERRGGTGTAGEWFSPSICRSSASRERGSGRPRSGPGDRSGAVRPGGAPAAGRSAQSSGHCPGAAVPCTG